MAQYTQQQINFINDIMNTVVESDKRYEESLEEGEHNVFYVTTHIVNDGEKIGTITYDPDFNSYIFTTPDHQEAQ